MYENVRYKVMQCVSFVSDWHTVSGTKLLWDKTITLYNNT